jgi:polyisoprenoid-binding protein YceI
VCFMQICDSKFAVCGFFAEHKGIQRTKRYDSLTCTPVKSTIRFGVKASVPIEGVFDKWDATLTFTSDHAEDGVLDVKIQAGSVNSGSGLKDGKLKSKDVFDV